MMHPFHRTELLVGGEGWERLKSASACVIGLGGVGSYAAEALARSGVGSMTLVDFDTVCVTNVNRQLHASRRTVGKSKAELMGDRARQINPKAEIVVIPKFYNSTSSAEILGDGFDVVLDCIDNMTAKMHLLQTCVESAQPVLCALGAGGRLDPTRVRVSDISHTHTDPFARIARDLLRQRGITSGIECVWSEEPPNDLDSDAQQRFRCICPGQDENTVHGCESRLQIQGSVSWMPAIFGLTMAGTAVNRLLERPVHGSDHPHIPRHRMRASASRPSRGHRKALLEGAGYGRAERAAENE